MDEECKGAQEVVEVVPEVAQVEELQPFVTIDFDPDKVWRIEPERIVW